MKNNFILLTCDRYVWRGDLYLQCCFPFYLGNCNFKCAFILKVPLLVIVEINVLCLTQLGTNASQPIRKGAFLLACAPSSSLPPSTHQRTHACVAYKRARRVTRAVIIHITLSPRASSSFSGLQLMRGGRARWIRASCWKTPLTSARGWKYTWKYDSSQHSGGKWPTREHFSLPFR